jgi:hypothetical protein
MVTNQHARFFNGEFSKEIEMKVSTEDTLLTVSSAARLARKSEASIRQAESRGILPAIRTATGMRLFKTSDVLKAFASKHSSARGPRQMIDDERDDNTVEVQELPCPNCGALAESIPTADRNLAIVRCASCGYSDIDQDLNE